MSPCKPQILVIAPSWLGDILLSQTLLRYVQFKYPQASIDMVAPDFAKPILDIMPELRTVFSLSVKHGELALKQRYHLSQTLKQHAYDQALVLPRSFKSALLPWLARIPKRTGFLGECRYGLINHRVALSPKETQTKSLMVQRLLKLVQDKDEPFETKTTILNRFKPKLSLKKTAPSSAKRFKLALCPGAAYGQAKRWPVSHFAKVADYGLKQGWDLVFLGGSDEIPLGQALDRLTQHQCENLIGKTSLIEVLEQLDQADCVVSNDSGLMHMAAALDKPLIALFGSSDPDNTPPLSDRATILSLKLSCSPCFQKSCPLKHLACLHNLSPEYVIQAIHEHRLS